MMPSRTRSEVRSQYNSKFNPGESTLDAPSPPSEAQRRPRIELPSRLAASVVYLCYRALDFRHVCTVANGSRRLCSPLLFSPGFLFSLSDSVWTPWLILNENEMNSIFDRAFLLCYPLVPSPLTHVMSSTMAETTDLASVMFVPMMPRGPRLAQPLQYMPGTPFTLPLNQKNEDKHHAKVQTHNSN